jgi:uncharacterized protein (DUF362 family)
MKDISRRDFLKVLGAGAATLIVRPGMTQTLDQLGKGLIPKDAPSNVVQCFDETSVAGTTIKAPVVQIMLDESIKTLTGQADVGEAWKAIFPGIAQTSVVGIKVNCINASCSTHPTVVNCIVNGLAQMIVGGTSFKKNNIIIWDRTNSELTGAGYTIYTGNDPNTVRCFGTDQSGIGYDNTRPLNVGGTTSYPSKILSQMISYLIDAAVLKDHSQGIITFGMKNHYGSINNPGSLSHSAGCTPSVPSLNQQIRDVLPITNIQKLTVIDATIGVYTGGPGGSPNCRPRSLIMSTDVVACDFVGQTLLNYERSRRGLAAVSSPQITMAAQPPYSLGTTDVNLIEINNPTAGKARQKRQAVR